MLPVNIKDVSKTETKAIDKLNYSPDYIGSATLAKNNESMDMEFENESLFNDTSAAKIFSTGFKDNE